MMALLRLIGPKGALVGLAGFVLLMLIVSAKMDARHWHKLADQNAARAAVLQAQLDRISSEKQAQKIITRTKIETVTRTIHEKAKAAEKVEQAPLPGQCRTPKEILDADI